MALLGPGLQTFDYAVEKGFDHIPGHVFSTKKEKRQWEQQEREKQRAEQRQKENEEQSSSDEAGAGRRRGSGSGRGGGSRRQQQQPRRRRPRSAGDDGQPPAAPPPDFYRPPLPPSQRRRDIDNTNLYSGAAAGAATGATADLAYNAYDSPRRRSRDVNNMQSDNGYYQPPGQDQRRSYNPSDYQPRDADTRVGYRRDDRSAYGDSYGGRASSSGPRSERYSGRYSDEYDDDDYRDRDDRSSRHRGSHHRDDSEEHSRGLGGIAGKFDKSEHGLATGALGALAGGVLGHEIGRGKGGVWPTVAGVVIGGLGANALEARHERKKHRDDGRSRSVDAGKHAFRSYQDDADDYEDRRSGRRDPSEYDDRRSGYDRYDR